MLTVKNMDEGKNIKKVDRKSKSEFQSKQKSLYKCEK